MCNIELTEKRINHTWLLDSYELIPILLNKLINTENNKQTSLFALSVGNILHAMNIGTAICIYIFQHIIIPYHRLDWNSTIL